MKEKEDIVEGGFDAPSQNSEGSGPQIKHRKCSVFPLLGSQPRSGYLLTPVMSSLTCCRKHNTCIPMTTHAQTHFLPHRSLEIIHFLTLIITPGRQWTRHQRCNLRQDTDLVVEKLTALGRVLSLGSWPGAMEEEVCESPAKQGPMCICVCVCVAGGYCSRKILYFSSDS